MERMCVVRDRTHGQWIWYRLGARRGSTKRVQRRGRRGETRRQRSDPLIPITVAVPCSCRLPSPTTSQHSRRAHSRAPRFVLNLLSPLLPACTAPNQSNLIFGPKLLLPTALDPGLPLCSTVYIDQPRNSGQDAPDPSALYVYCGRVRGRNEMRSAMLRG
jgi:hypothetical protein